MTKQDSAISAVPAAGREPAGSHAAAEWARIQEEAPQLAATMRRYLTQVAAFLAPRSVDVAGSTLRQLARWILASTGIEAITEIRRDDIEDYKVWLARQPGNNGTLSANTHRQRLRTLRAFSGADHRVGLARRPAPQPSDRLGHPQKTRAAAEVPRRP